MTSFIIAKTYFYWLHNQEGLVSGLVKQAKLDTTQGVVTVNRNRVLGFASRKGIITPAAVVQRA